MEINMHPFCSSLGNKVRELLSLPLSVGKVIITYGRTSLHGRRVDMSIDTYLHGSHGSCFGFDLIEASIDDLNKYNPDLRFTKEVTLQELHTDGKFYNVADIHYIRVVKV